MIVLPLLAPAITVNVILALIQGLKFFDQVFVLTGGGPGYATETLSTIIYKTSFIYSEFGYGSAISLVFSLIVGVVVFSATVALRRREIAHG
jgi:raffinose/stachyose/melibiose transport system permease protein